MKKLIKELRFLLATKMMLWTMSIIPPGKEREMYCQKVHNLIVMQIMRTFHETNKDI